jgi:hypothetical protein
MNVDQVISINIKIWDRYFKKVSILKPLEGNLLFPNLILITETPKFHIIELLGVNEKFKDLAIKKNKCESIETYLFQFNHINSFENECIDSNKLNFSSFKNILIGSKIDEKTEDKRFKFLERWQSRITSKVNTPNILSLHKANNYIEFNDSCLVNILSNTTRIKSINHLHIITKNVDIKQYKNKLIKDLSVKINNTTNLTGILYSRKLKTTTNILFSQFLNVYSIPKLRETTIGEFLNKNQIILQKAFNSNHLLYEPNFEWIDGNPDETEKSINPDFLIKREDGFYDICDLKLPYLEKNKLTKGQRKRRSFLQIVDEAISQLANYEDYFSFPENSKLAKSKYMVEINNPILIIIIGNYNNYNKSEIEEASRKLKSNYRIIDYDTLNTMAMYN